MTYEFVYITIEYQCGCVVIRPELVARVSLLEKREGDRCPHHRELHQSRTETSQARERESIAWPPVGQEASAS